MTAMKTKEKEMKEEKEAERQVRSRPTILGKTFVMAWLTNLLSTETHNFDQGGQGEEGGEAARLAAGLRSWLTC